MKDFEVCTADVRQNVKKAKTLKDVLDMLKKDITLKDYLDRMLFEKDLTVADVQRDSGVKPSYIYQIFGGKKENPTRNVLLAIAFGLHLNELETQRLLRLGGHSELYVRRKRDAIILFCIDHEYSLYQTDDVLDENDEHTINPNH